MAEELAQKNKTKHTHVEMRRTSRCGLLTWLLGLQQLIVYFSPDQTQVSERWTLPKLQLQKLRLKVSGESDRTGQGPFDVVLSAVLDAAQEKQAQQVTTWPWCLPTCLLSGSSAPLLSRSAVPSPSSLRAYHGLTSPPRAAQTTSPPPKRRVLRPL